MGEIELIKGDITEMEVEAIVNPTNTALLSGGENGVNGVIHRKGGEAIADACKQIRIKLGGCKHGDSVLTTAGNLPAKYVIHTVGPVWKGGDHNEAEVLTNAYINSLKLAAENGIKTVAFPNISTGIYGFPKKEAAEIAIDAVYRGLVRNIEVEKVFLVCHNEENYLLYKELLAEDEENN